MRAYTSPETHYPDNEEDSENQGPAGGNQQTGEALYQDDERGTKDGSPRVPAPPRMTMSITRAEVENPM